MNTCTVLHLLKENTNTVFRAINNAKSRIVFVIIIINIITIQVAS